jgi:hypothetical protein
MHVLRARSFISGDADHPLRLKSRRLGMAVTLLLLIVAAVVLVTKPRASNGPAVANGPLGESGSNPGTVCVIRDPSASRFTHGYEVLEHSGTRDLKIDRVELVDPEGVALDQALVVPVNRRLIGSWGQFPPPDDVLQATGVGWTERREAAGALLSPGSTHNIVMVLSDTNPEEEAAIRGLRVSYVEPSTNEKYVLTTALEFVVQDSCEES